MNAEAQPLPQPWFDHDSPREITDTPTSFALPGGSAELFARTTDVDPKLWAAAFGDQPKDFEYYRLIEDTMTEGYSYRYLVLRDARGRVAALQPLLIADQDLTASSGDFIGRAAAAIRRFAPRFLRSRMLMAGCLVGDAMIGVVPGADATEAVRLLADALVQLAKQERISLITVKDFPATERAVLAPLVEANYCRLASFPPMKLALNFESFDEYLEKRLSKVTRKGLRRKLRKTTDTPLELEVTDDCREVIDEIYPLYLAVAEKSDVSFEVFTKAYFVEASRRMSERFRFFIWRHAGKAVAFSFCTVTRDAIYDNDIGLDYAVAHDLNLYYVTFRDLIQWALAHGFREYHSAPFNYDPKLHLRLEPVAVDIYVRHKSPLINRVLQRFAPHFAPAKSDPALRRYLRL